MGKDGLGLSTTENLNFEGIKTSMTAKMVSTQLLLSAEARMTCMKPPPTERLPQ